MRISEREIRIIRSFIAVGIAFAIGLIITILVSEEPYEAFRSLILGPFSTIRRMGNIIELAIPLTLTGLAVSVVLLARQFNLGAEGQLFIGGVFAAIIGIIFNLPMYIHLPFAIITSMIIGALAGAIPGFLKAKWGASELVSSLMLNYVFFRLGLYLVNHHFRDLRAGTMVSYYISETARLGRLFPPTRIHWGIFIAIGSVVATYLFLYKTKWGYALRMTGNNKSFAKYAGINVFSVIIYSHAISGGLAGLAGASDVLGIFYRFEWQALPGYGFDGIIVAIISRFNPIAIPFAALFLSYLRNGASIMSRMSDVSSEMVAIIQGIIILLVTAEAFLSGIYQRIVKKEAQKRVRDSE